MVHAIQRENSSGPAAAEREEMSITPTLNSGRGRNGGVPSLGSSGSRDCGTVDNSARPYTWSGQQNRNPRMEDCIP